MVKTTGWAATLALIGMLGAMEVRVEGADLSATLSPQETNGAIGYAGGSAPLIGTNIGVASITGLETPAKGASASLPLVSGLLNFTTGASAGASASTGEWDFAQGGSLTLSGEIPGLGINTSAALLSGSFSNPTYVKTLDGGLKVQGGAFFSVVNPTLASYFGLPKGGVLYRGGLATLFHANGTAPGSFRSDGFTGGTLTVTPDVANLPEPASLAVFAALAMAGGFWARRRGA